jgi:alcohol dehydrogenase class IV
LTGQCSSFGSVLAIVVTAAMALLAVTNMTKTTAPHAISYALTTHFGIIHGHAVALMLPSILMFNEGVTDTDILAQRDCV